MDSLKRLADTVARLRSPEGCPWDRQQTLRSVRPYLLEECYEALEALDREDYPALAAELGDLLLQIFLQAQIAKEEGAFDIEQVAALVNEKIVRRHPHVFGKAEAHTPDEVLRLWGRMKQEECRENAVAESRLGGVPRTLPALQRAQRLQGRAAAAGFDWQAAGGALEQAEREIQELRQAHRESDPSKIEEEFGDLLFSLVNAARFLGVDAEAALRRSTEKFARRFQRMEALAEASGRVFDALSAEEMDQLWRRVKEEKDSRGG